MPEAMYDGGWGERERLAEYLQSCGLSAPAAAAKAGLFGRAAAGWGLGPGPAPQPCYACYVPGRIEVLGKHTDYAGGSSLVSATERGFCLVARPRDDAVVVVTDAARGETARFAIHPELTPTAGHWSNYPMTVARRMARNFPGAQRGADVAFASDLPPAAGMSSSSALMVAVFFALAEANELWQQPDFPPELRAPLTLAGYLGTVENGQSFGPLAGDRGVGTFGGSEDQTAILCAQPGTVSQYAYCPVRFERAIPVPAGHVFAVGSSGVAAEKTGAARERYNQASRLATALADRWRQHTGRDDPHLAAALRSAPAAVQRFRELVATTGAESERPALIARLEHFLAENEEILPAAGAALSQGDLDGFGRWVDRSQQAAEHLLGNQIAETCCLAALARERGAAAASAFGAGFGGSVWALVAAADAQAFVTAWRAAYRDRFPQHAAAAGFFLTAAGPAMFRLR